MDPAQSTQTRSGMRANPMTPEEMKEHDDRTIHVANLVNVIPNHVIEEVFGRYGKIVDFSRHAKLRDMNGSTVPDEHGDVHEFGFITFVDKTAAQHAMTVGDVMINEHNLVVRPRTRRPTERRDHSHNYNRQAQNAYSTQRDIGSQVGYEHPNGPMTKAQHGRGPQSRGKTYPSKSRDTNYLSQQSNPEIRQSKVVTIMNIPLEVPMEEIAALCHRYGRVLKMDFLDMTDYGSGRCACITMESYAGAKKVVDNVNHMVLRNKILQACYQNQVTSFGGNPYSTGFNGQYNGHIQSPLGPVLSDRNIGYMNNTERYNPVVVPATFNPWYTTSTGVENQPNAMSMPAGAGSFVPQTRTWQPSHTQPENYTPNVAHSLKPRRVRDQTADNDTQAQYRAQGTHLPTAHTPHRNSNLRNEVSSGPSQVSNEPPKVSAERDITAGTISHLGKDPFVDDKATVPDIVVNIRRPVIITPEHYRQAGYQYNLSVNAPTTVGMEPKLIEAVRSELAEASPGPQVPETDDPEDPSNLFVKNIDEEIISSEADLKVLFSEFGTIVSAHLETLDNGRTLGWGFVKYTCQEYADMAKKLMHNRMVGSKRLYVGVAESKERRERRLSQIFGKTTATTNSHADRSPVCSTNPDKHEEQEEIVKPEITPDKIDEDQKESTRYDPDLANSNIEVKDEIGTSPEPVIVQMNESVQAQTTDMIPKGNKQKVQDSNPDIMSKEADPPEMSINKADVNKVDVFESAENMKTSTKHDQTSVQPRIDQRTFSQVAKIGTIHVQTMENKLQSGTSHEKARQDMKQPSQTSPGSLQNPEVEKANVSPPKIKQTGNSSNKTKKQKSKAQKEKINMIIEPAIPSLKRAFVTEQGNPPVEPLDKITKSITAASPDRSESKAADTSASEATLDSQFNTRAVDDGTASSNSVISQHTTATTSDRSNSSKGGAKHEATDHPSRTSHLATIKEVAEDDSKKTSVKSHQAKNTSLPLKEHKRAKSLTDVQCASKNEPETSLANDSTLTERNINSIEHKLPDVSETNMVDNFSYQLTPPYYGSSGPAFSHHISPKHMRRSPGTAYNNMAQYPAPAPFTPVGPPILPIQNYGMPQQFVPTHMGMSYPHTQFTGGFNGQMEAFNHFSAPPDAHYTYQQPVYGYTTSEICQPYQVAPLQQQGYSFPNMLTENTHIPGKRFVHNDGASNIRRGKKENFRPRYAPKVQNNNGGEMIPVSSPSLNQVRPLSDNAIMMHGISTAHAAQNAKNGQ